MPILCDLKGQRFGNLVALWRARDRGTKKVYWHCQCDCGGTSEVISSSLTRGQTKSCGCGQFGHEKHGGSRLPEYQVWLGMKARCQNPAHNAYENYGGRGIFVCDRWSSDFAAFYCDMGSRPSSHHTIERVNNDEGYSPSNCIWATRKEQNKNQRPRKAKTHCKRGHARQPGQPCIPCRKILWRQWSQRNPERSHANG